MFMVIGVLGVISMFCVIFTIMAIMLMAIMLLWGMVVGVVVMTMIVVIVMSVMSGIIPLKSRLGRHKRTICRLGQLKQIERRAERRNGRINRREVSIALGQIFKTYDVRARRIEQHRNGRAVNRDIKRPHAMFMGIKRAPILCKRRVSRNKSNKRKAVFHYNSNKIG